MDRDAIARRRRRQEVVEALEFEREREAALREQVEETVLEEERSRVDREALARLDPADAEIVRELLDDGGELVIWDEEGDEEVFAHADVDDDEGGGAAEEAAEEIARLLGEIDLSHARQRALERFVRALEQPPTAPADV